MTELNARKILFYVLCMLMLMPSLSAQEKEGDSAPNTDASASKSKLIISGNVYVDGLRLDHVLVTLLEDNRVIDEVRTDENGKFKIEIALDKMQVIEFSKENFMGKKVDVDTRNVPEGERKYDYYNKGWKVDLYPSNLDIDFSVLKKPVALIVYNPANGDFSIDKKYEKSVRPGLERLAKNAYNAYEQKDMDQEDAYDDYMLAVKDGDAFLKEGDYENALMQYEAAKEILPNEQYPDKQIKKTMAIMQSNASVDELYASHLQTADEAFNSKEWELARKSYEQASDVKPNLDYPKDQIDIIINNIAEEKLLAAKLKEKEKQDLYNGYVASADSLLALKLYAKSKSKYTEANSILPKEAYPKNKVKEIDAFLAANAKSEQEYNKIIATAGELLSKGDYENAKAEYAKAEVLKPSEELPKTKIAEIDGLLAGAAALKAKELKMAADKEAARLAKYDALILSADALMVDKSYELAKADYEKALLVKAEEVYPKNQILLIDKTLAEIEGVDKQYEKLMANAGKNASLNNFELAKTNYSEALALKPAEQAPKDGIAAMDAKLLAIQTDLKAKQKALDDSYNGFVANGDALLAEEKLNEAQSAYKQALSVKPQEEYPKEQILAINKTLAELERVDKQFDKLMASAVKNASVKKFELAKNDYSEALALKPDEQAPKDGIAAMDAKLMAIQADILAQQKALDDKYNGFVADGDAFLAVEKLTEAENSYKEALAVKPNEAYPKSQLTIINEKLGVLAATAAANEKKAKILAEKTNRYNAAIGKADQMLQNENLIGAKAEYQNALTILPEKTYPASQIAEIDGKLELAAAALAENERKEAELKAKNDSYQAAITKADADFAAKNYAQARIGYQNAQKVLADKAYPGLQIEKITKLELAEQQAKEQALLLAAQQAENQKKFDEIVAEGDKLIAEGDLQKGKYKYEAALKIIVGDEAVIKKMRDVTEQIEEDRKLAEFHAKNDTEFNRQLAETYPNGLNETTKKSGKTTTRIVVVSNGRGDEYKKEVYSYGAVFYFKNGKKIDENTYKRETKGH
tara:strand:+ start:186804 stop:189926 length:3123 start_codon:yes stop_codon:yes gene_type:complete